MFGHYILVGQTPVPCDDLMEWAAWFEEADRRVFETCAGDYRVSTVFLGLDHSFGHGPPILFETMIFLNTPEARLRPDESFTDWCERRRELTKEDELDSYQRRAASWLEAEAEHEVAVMTVEEKTGAQREAVAVTYTVAE